MVEFPSVFRVLGAKLHAPGEGVSPLVSLDGQLHLISETKGKTNLKSYLNQQRLRLCNSKVAGSAEREISLRKRQIRCFMFSTGT